MHFTKDVLATEDGRPVAEGNSTTVNELIAEGMPAAQARPFPNVGCLFSSYYAEGIENNDAENLKHLGVLSCANAIFFVVPKNLHNIDTKKQVQNAISILERWLQYKNTLSGQFLGLFPPYSPLKQTVIEALAKWYGCEYQLSAASNDRNASNYAPCIGTKAWEVLEDTYECMLHARWETLRGTDAQKVQAIIDYKNRLYAQPRHNA